MTYTPDCLKAKVILITGGLGAIGKVVVRQLLDHSAQVVVNDIVPEAQAQKWIAEAGWPLERCLYVPADATKPPEAQAVVEKTVAAFRRLDVALCHAGHGPVLPDP